MLTLDMLLDCDKPEIKANIERVAIYPRRSRKSEGNKNMTEDEVEKDLLHQSKRLKSLCETNGWIYEDYTEIGSGENIDDRPHMSRLLEDIRDGKFDAIAVTELSRLTRGSGTDQDRILIALRNNNVVILEAEHSILNPFSKSDLDRFRMMSMVNNFEYAGTVERFTQAKRVKASEGQWVNATCPFGYKKDRKTKKLIIDDEKGKIYREMMLLPFLEGTSTGDIAWNLNKAKIPSPRGGMWERTTILRMLKDETYCGNIIYNKTMGSKKNKDSVNKMPYRKMPPEKWIRAYNAHPALKSQEEHMKVLDLLKKKGFTRGDINYHPLSGMVKCSFCNKTMIISQSESKPLLRKCVCGKNRGGSLDVANDVIYTGAVILKKTLLEINESDVNHNEKKDLIKQIEKLEEKVQIENKAIERIDDALAYGYFSFEEATSKKKGKLELIYDLEERILKKKEQLNSFNVMSNKEKIKRIDTFLSEMENANTEEKIRTLYTDIIDFISWNREDDDTIEVKVNFL